MLESLTTGRLTQVWELMTDTRDPEWATAAVCETWLQSLLSDGDDEITRVEVIVGRLMNRSWPLVEDLSSLRRWSGSSRERRRTGEATSKMPRCSEPARVRGLFKELMRQKVESFPQHGRPNAENSAGVYVIHGAKGTVMHVGKSCDVKQRLYDHLSSRSSFAKKYLDGDGKRLRNGRYVFRYLLVKNDRRRALLEALAIGDLCPKHIGHGYVRNV